MVNMYASVYVCERDTEKERVKTNTDKVEQLA